MPELPVVSGRDLRAALERLGFKRQTGSHMILTKPGIWRASPCPTTASSPLERCAL
jgi:predicted RNA binding protein YcfA (HicA-like mRNA interferase family)